MHTSDDIVTHDANFFPQMKAILFILLCALAAWGGWAAYPSMRRTADEKVAARKAEQEKLEQTIRNRTLQDSRLDPKTGTSQAASLLASLNNGTPQITPSTPGGPALPGPGTAPTPGAGSTAPAAPVGPKDEMETRYPMPTFKPIEEITKEWTSIPSRAFPRKVKTKVPVIFEAASGKVELPSGSDARAVGMVQGMLIIMREGDESTRIQVPLANTDLKETLTSLYEKFKEYKRNVVIKQREHARAVKANANGATDDQMKLAGGKPSQDSGGVVSIMLDSIRALKLTELKENSITSWGEINFEMIDGQPYWTGTVQCMVENAIFGPQPTEVMALMRNGKVVKWIYSGSREDVQ